MSRRVLSMWQPWASFMLSPTTALPVKRWETRAFPPRQKLPIDIVIHAALRNDQVRQIYSNPAYVEAQEKAGIHHFPLGKIIGVATIVEVVHTEAAVYRYQTGVTGNGPDWLDLQLGDYTPGRYAWRFAFAEPLPQPIPFKGRQSVLWELDPEIDLEISRQLHRKRDAAARELNKYPGARQM